MSSIFSAVITGIVTFAATNVDDLFILMVVLLADRRLFPATAYRGRPISRFCSSRRDQPAWLLRKFYFADRLDRSARFSSDCHGSQKALLSGVEILDLADSKRRGMNLQSRPCLSGLFSRQTLGVAAVTFANGGDNLGIYTPLFAGSSLIRLGIFLVVFFALVGGWCYAGFLLSRRPIIAEICSRYGRLLVPFVLVGLGVYILIESGAATLMSGWIRYS